MTMTASRKSEHFARPMPIRMKSSSRVTAYETASKGRQERGLKSRNRRSTGSLPIYGRSNWARDVGLYCAEFVVTQIVGVQREAGTRK